MGFFEDVAKEFGVYSDSSTVIMDNSSLESQASSTFMTQIPALFLIIMAILVLFFFYRYIFLPEKVIATNVDPPEEGKMTAQEYNKKTDAQMEAIRSGRFDYKEPSAKSITETKGIPDGWTGRLSGFMGAIGLVIGFVKQGGAFFERLLPAVSFGLIFTTVTATITYISVMIFNAALKASNAKQNTFLQGVVFAWVVMGVLVALDFALFQGTFFIALILGYGF